MCNIKVYKNRHGNETLSELQSLHQDLKRFQEIWILTPDVKTGLGIAIEQVERYISGELKARNK